MKVILPLAVVIAVLLFFGVGGVNSLVRQDEDVNEIGRASCRERV